MATRASTERRPRSRRGEGDKLREEIMDAALALLFETGDSEAVSIRAVAERVGVTPPSIYLHFADKNDLLLAVCEQQFSELDRVTSEAAAASTDPLESLRSMGRAYVRFGLEHPEHYRILFMHKPWDMQGTDHIDRLRSRSGFDHVVEGVAMCMERGLLAPGDPFLAALDLWISVHGLTSLLISKPDFPWPPTDDLVDFIVSVQTRGLQP